MLIDIDSSDEHRITYHEFNPQSEKIIICFARQGGGMGRSGFGGDFCKKNGWNYIYVGKLKHTRFRSLSIDRFRDKISPYIEGRDTICYGPSAGGYAALYFGGIINARILAASPRNSQHPINQGLKNWNHPENKESAQFYHAAQLKDVPRSKHSPTVIYDFLASKDHRFVRDWAMPAYDDLIAINVPNSGHRTLDRLKELKTLSTMVRSFVNDGKVDEDNIRAAEGSLDRQLDDAVIAYVEKKYAVAAALLYPHVQHLRERQLLGLYIKCVSLSGDRTHAALMANAFRQEKIKVELLRPDIKRHLDLSLSQIELRQ